MEDENRTQEVGGSNPLVSTRFIKRFPRITVYRRARWCLTGALKHGIQAFSDPLE